MIDRISLQDPPAPAAERRVATSQTLSQAPSSAHAPSRKILLRLTDAAVMDAAVMASIAVIGAAAAAAFSGEGRLGMAAPAAASAPSFAVLQPPLSRAGDFPLVLRGISGEALTGGGLGGGLAAISFSRTFTAPSASAGGAPADDSGALKTADAAAATRHAGEERAPHKTNAPAKADAPAPDYVLARSRPSAPPQGEPLQTASLQASWRAVVETLLLTGEPTPAVVHDM